MQFQACPPFPVAKLGGLVPAKYLEALEQNQKLALCCRHPENHTIEALYSCEAERDRGMPDIYIFTCDCGKKHRRFCVGGGDVRPFWEVR